MGFAISSAATRLAEIKHQLGVSDSVFGYALACTTLGSLTGNALAHRLIVRWGSRRITQVFCTLMMLSVGLYGSATHVWQLAVMAYFCSFGYSVANISTNSQGVDVEVHLKRSVMPSFHASWSVGSLSTAILGGLVAAVMPPRWHLLGIAVLAITAMLASSKRLLPFDHVDEADSDHRSPLSPETKKLLFITAIGASLGLIAEVSALDWSSIYLHETLGISLGLNALGVTSFLLAQICSRLIVGKLNDRFGVHRVVRTAAIIGAAGYLGSNFMLRFGVDSGSIDLGSTAALVIACLGFVLLGLGVGPLPAAYFSAAGRVSGISTARGIGMLALMNSSILLILRPLISWSTDAFSISFALLLAGFALFGSAALSRILAPVALRHDH
jgi:MFS family permease